ncbi:hypothetical protein [Lysobacter gummosus]|uniref:hypothetical protein n=1 Tax=Lysobacter gummosus TaxID=262324 RepID=UPI00362D15C8
MSSDKRVVRGQAFHAAIAFAVFPVQVAAERTNPTGTNSVPALRPPASGANVFPASQHAPGPRLC